MIKYNISDNGTKLIITVTNTNTNKCIFSVKLFRKCIYLQLEPHSNFSTPFTNFSLWKILQKIILHGNFNQPFDVPKHTVFLRFGYTFNQPIILPKNTRTLVLSHDFNKHLTLPKNLIALALGFGFLQKLALPEKIHVLFTSFQVRTDTITLIDTLPNTCNVLLDIGTRCWENNLNQPNSVKCALNNITGHCLLCKEYDLWFSTH